MSHSALAIAGFYDHEEQTTRRAPDWGGDDLFTTAPPRRRRDHGTEDGRYGRPRDRAAHRAPESGSDADRAADLERDDLVPTAPARDLDRYTEPVPAGRRTVTITGRPERLAVARRPARTLDERIAHRPERIASWTCAMGFLLILLAVLTAN